MQATSKPLGCNPKAESAHSVPQSIEDQSKTKVNTGEMETDIKSVIINNALTATMWSLNKILRDTEMT